MNRLTVAAQEQVNLSNEILEYLGIGPGNELVVDKLPRGEIRMRASRPKGKISDVFGYLAREHGPSLTIDEMNEIIALGRAGKL
jgi:hypothetical protein